MKQYWTAPVSATSSLMCAGLVSLCSACPQLLDDGFRAQSELHDGRDASVPAMHPPPLDRSAIERGEPDSGVAAPPPSTPAGDAAHPDDGAGTDAGAIPARTCRSGSQPTASGACYALFETKLNWSAARTQCRGQGSGWDLASIRSNRDSELLVPLIQSETWVGASDQASEGSWLWVDDGTVFWHDSGTNGSAVAGIYTNWNSDEPNGSDPSDCMRIIPGAKWADFQCGNTLGYLCMGPPD
jgi:hypothetical protein